MSNPLKTFLRYCFPNRDTPSQLAQLKELIEMNQAELRDALQAVVTALNGVGTQLEKATNEIIIAIQNTGATSPEVDVAVASLQAVATALTTAAQALDDLNPDAVPVP